MPTKPNTGGDKPLAEIKADQQEAADASAPAKIEATTPKGDLKVAVNLIVQTGADGKPEEVLPGTTFRPAKIDVDFLTKHDAVREPTDGERAMHERVEEMQAKAAASPDPLA